MGAFLFNIPDAMHDALRTRAVGEAISCTEFLRRAVTSELGMSGTYCHTVWVPEAVVASGCILVIRST